jgi:microcystin degradation protein MlrC
MHRVGSEHAVKAGDQWWIDGRVARRAFGDGIEASCLQRGAAPIRRLVMRLALLGLAHETNTFVSRPTTIANFESYGILRDSAIRAEHATAHTSVSGFLRAEVDSDVEVVPLVYAWANPSGVITDQAYEGLTGELCRRLRRDGPWDGVLMAQHGAAVSATYRDADGEFIRRVREIVGDETPIGVAVDMHANMSAAMVEHATVIVGYRTNPHIDARERAEECAALVVATARGRIHPQTAFEPIPAVINIVRQSTIDSPMSEIMGIAMAEMGEPRMLSVTVCEGYPYADVSEMGISCLAISDGDPAVARAAVHRIAGAIWSLRSEFGGQPPPPEDAVRLVGTDANGPDVLLDVGDNIGGGGPGDSTVLLDAAIQAGIRGFVVTLYDPEAARECVEVGVGASISIDVGGKTDDRHGRPIPLHATIRRITDGKYEEPAATHGGFRFFDSGPTVVLEIPGDNLVVLTSKRVMPTSLEQLRSLGIEPEKRRMIVAKGVVSPRAAYEPIAAQLMLVNTPGVTSCDLKTFNFRRRRRPLYPFEAMP